jgi:hypothetical protein
MRVEYRPTMINLTHMVNIVAKELISIVSVVPVRSFAALGCSKQPSGMPNRHPTLTRKGWAHEMEESDCDKMIDDAALHCHQTTRARSPLSPHHTTLTPPPSPPSASGTRC